MDCAVTLSGNLTRDPELRFTSSGQAVASGSIAVSRRWKAGDQWQEKTSFFNFVAWGELGENLCQSARKGDRYVLVGRIEQDEYETREGEKRTAVKVIVDDAAPSLKWATAVIERTRRTGGGDTRQRESSRSNPGRDAGGYGDEEPF